MRLKDEPRRLLIRNSRRLHWILGVLVAAVGGVVLLGALGLVSDGKTYTLPSRIGAGLFGSVVVVLGGWVCWRAPRSTLVVDRAGQTVTLTRRGFFRTIREEYPADTIADVRVTKERDGKGNPTYRVEMVLHAGNVVPIPLMRPHDREGCMQAAQHLWTALGLPRA